MNSVVAATVILLSLNFNDGAPTGALTHVKDGGVDNSGCIRSTAGTYKIFRTDWLDLEPGTTYRVSMMVKSPTGARPMIFPQVFLKGKNVYLYHRSLLQKPLPKDGPWTKVSGTFTVTEKTIMQFGDQMKKAYEKAKQKNPDARPSFLQKAWVADPPSLDKGLRFRVQFFNWAASGWAEKRKMKIDDSVLMIDDVVIEKIPNQDK